MARIVIDGRMISLTGIGRYIVSLLDNLPRLDNHNEYVVLLQPRDKDYWNPSAPNFQKVIIDAPEYTVREQVMLPMKLRRLRPDLVHFPSPNAPLFYKGRFVVTVQDLTLLKFRNVRRSRLRYEVKFRAFRAVISHAVRAADTIIATTEFGKKELGAFFGRSLLEKTAVTSLAADPPSTGAKGTPLVAPPFILYVGNYFPYKNIRRLIDAMPAIIQTHPGMKLLLVGNPGFFGRELKHRVKSLGLGDTVIFTGYVSDQQRNQLYRQASLYVFPSISEGFGIPGLEAMSYGTPVAAARATVLPEVYGSAAVYFDPLDTNDIAKVISKTLADRRRLAALKKAGLHRVKEFSWRHTAEQTLAIYEQALKK